MNEQSLQTITLPTAYMSNVLATRGVIDLTNAREWTLFLFLVAQLDPQNEGDLTDAIVSVQDLENLLKSNNSAKWGGLYNELRACSKRMAKAICEFDSDVRIEGKVLPRTRPIFSEINPFKTKEGSVFIKYCFNERMKPLLLGFKKNFMGIKPPIGIKSSHAIRFLILAKAERDRKRKYEKVTILYYAIKDLKALLGIENKYKEYDNFRRRVIEPIFEGVNKSGVVTIASWTPSKTGRKTTHITFEIQDSPQYSPLQIEVLPEETENKPLEDENMPTDGEFSSLTFAQRKAYDFLLERKIYGGIAVRKIIPKMPSSICEGYEDYFCEEAYKIVIEKSKADTDIGRAKVFVDWFKKDIFKDDQFSRIVEAVHARRKSLPLEKRANREMAMDIPHDEFVKLYRAQEVQKVRTSGVQNAPNLREKAIDLEDLARRIGEKGQ